MDQHDHAHNHTLVAHTTRMSDVSPLIAQLAKILGLDVPPVRCMQVSQNYYCNTGR